MGGAGIGVDGWAVRRDPGGIYLSGPVPGGRLRDPLGGGNGPIDHLPEPHGAQMFGEGRLCEMDIAALRVVDTRGAADAFGLRQIGSTVDQRLDDGFVLVGKLYAVRPEQLAAVIGERVVNGGEDRKRVG